MYAWTVTEFNHNPRVLSNALRSISAKDIIIEIKACGLNYADLLMIKGTYQATPAPPFTLGLELSGVVTAVGPECSWICIGDRVAVYGGGGGLATSGIFAESRCIKMPDSMSFEEAAGFQIAYGTSHLALLKRARLTAGETLCVLGAGGGVGLTAVEIGVALGAHVIAVARGPEKGSILYNYGAKDVVDVQPEQLKDILMSHGGIDVLYDPIGGAFAEQAIRALNPLGRAIIIGFASGELPTLRANHLMVKNIDVIGMNWGGYLDFAPNILMDSLAELLNWYDAGRIKPHIGAILPFERALEGWDMLRSRTAIGKIVISMGT